MLKVLPQAFCLLCSCWLLLAKAAGCARHAGAGGRLREACASDAIFFFLYMENTTSVYLIPPHTFPVPLATPGPHQQCQPQAGPSCWHLSSLPHHKKHLTSYPLLPSSQHLSGHVMQVTMRSEAHINHMYFLLLLQYFCFSWMARPLHQPLCSPI